MTDVLKALQKDTERIGCVIILSTGRFGLDLLCLGRSRRGINPSDESKIYKS